MKFKELSLEQSFDFINDDTPGYNSFFKRCTKISNRKYEDDYGVTHTIGSINADVYHVKDQIV